MLDKPVYRMLEGWVERARSEGGTAVACKLHTHLAYLFKHVEQRELTPQGVRALVLANLYVNIHYQFDLDVQRNVSVKRSAVQEKSSSGKPSLQPLGFPQTEIFDLFQAQRSNVLGWLQAHPDDCSSIMEGIVQYLSGTSNKGSSGKQSSGLTSGDSGLRARRWSSMPQPGNAGRFVPDTESVLRRKLTTADGKMRTSSMNKRMELDLADTYEAMSFEEYLRETTRATVDLEINIQLGELTVKKNTLEVLDEAYGTLPDFVAVLGGADTLRLKCAEVKNTTHRSWLRVVGKRHDLQLWDPDPRVPQLAFNRQFKQGRGLSRAEGWIAQALSRPQVAKHVAHLELYLPNSNCAEEPFVCLAAREMFVARTAGGNSALISSQGDDDSHTSSTSFKHFAGKPTVRPLAFLREVCVYRSSGVVHLFNVVPHGRRFMRSLVWASDAALCLHDGEAALGFVGGEMDDDPSSAAGPSATASTPTLQILEQEAYAGRAATEPSLVILRNILREIGVQVYVPRRFLRGLLPAALLCAYDFWQNGDDSLIGYPAAEHAAAATAAPSGGAESDTTAAAVGAGTAAAGCSTVVRVLLRKEEEPDRSGFGRAEATASVMRVAMMPLGGDNSAPSRDILANPSTEPFEAASPLVQAVEDPTQEPLTLLNLLLAVGDAGLSERDEAQAWQAMAMLAELLLRVEDLSHILVWHHGVPPEADDDGVGVGSTPQRCRVHLVELPRLGLTFAPKRAYQDRSAPGELLGKPGAVDPWRFDPFADSNAAALAPDTDPFEDPFEPSAVVAEVRPPTPQHAGLASRVVS